MMPSDSVEHVRRGRASRVCAEVAVISDCMHARFYTLISRKYKLALGHFWRSLKVFQRVWLYRKLLARPGMASRWGFRIFVYFETAK